MELTVHIPFDVDLDERDAKTMFAAKLYEAGKLTLGQAAEVAGYSKRTFMELLSNYNVPLFQITEDELIDDIENAGKYHHR